MIRRYDLRFTTKAQLQKAIDDAEYLAKASVGPRAEKQFQWDYPYLHVTWANPPNPSALSFGRALDNAVEEINRENRMSVTGASALAQNFREMLAAVKADIAKTHTEMSGAITELRDTAVQAAGMVKAIKAESADLKASLGLSSNNPPTEGAT